MKEKRNLVQQLLRQMDLEGESIPGKSLVEIAGNQRVLIENHMGVKAYSRERILIQVKSGTVEICGCCLELCQMTREQLVITGRIAGVTLHGREKQ